jgi:hypothetical protein
MTEGILIAIIGSGVGLLGVLLGVFKEQIIGVFQKSSRSIGGHWSGEASDVEVKGVIEYQNTEKYNVEMQLKQFGRTISGTAVVKSDTRKHTHHITGKLVSQELVELNYKLKVDGSIHSGRLMLRVNGVGKEMNGYFLAKRAFEIGHVFGYIKLTKNT